MTARTFDELFDPAKPTLTLEETDSGAYTASDQLGRIFYRSADMQSVIRFMRALALRGDVTLDEGSITWFRALRAFGEFSVGVGSLSERSFAAEAGRTDLTGDITGSDHVPVPLRSESDRKSERGTAGGAGLRTAPVTSAAVNEPTTPLSEIGAAAHTPPSPAAPITLRLVN